ncbi:MAG: AAA family ATPase [Chloroflexi bacterium]|nr:AAA family ATPase [Chloroflexota bacterium]
MKRYISPILLLAFVITSLWLVSPLWAQTYPNAWRTYDQFDGLAGNWVYDSVQSTDHALWFGTDEGVSRFDGAWRTYSSQDGLPEGAIRALLVTQTGHLWAGTQTGVYAWDNVSWKLVGAADGVEQPPIRTLLQDGEGTIYAGGEAGLYRWDADAGLWLAERAVPTVTALVRDAKGSLWLASENALYQQKGNEWFSVPLIVGDKPIVAVITALASSQEGGLWIGTEGDGMGYYSEGVLTWYNQDSGLPAQYILSLREDHDGSIWIGTNGNGVMQMAENSLDQFTIADGIAADFVTSIFQDQDNVFWFGTVAGISRFDNQTWRKWAASDSAPTSLVSSLAVGANDELWVGTYGQGLNQLYETDWLQMNGALEGLIGPEDFIESMYVDDRGELWLGSNGAGVIHIGEQGTSQWTTDHGLAGDIITAIAETADGALWFGSFENGLSRWDGQSWQTFTAERGLADDSVKSLLVDSKGRLWVGTRNGVSVLDGGHWQNYTVEQGLAAAEITDIAEAADGSIWFATWGGGVNRFDEGNWTTFNTSDGLLAPGVEAIYTDPASSDIWFGTVSGLSTYDGLSWQNFRSADGNEIGRIYAIAPSPQGGLYLGTSEGVARYLPDHTPPRAQVLTINGIAPEQGKIILTPQEQVQVTLAGNDLLTDANDLFFVYRLVDHDADWSISRNETITYPPLPEGAYRFEVMARDASMNYSQPHAIDIEVMTAPSTVILPWLGPVRSEYALAGVAIATIIALLFIYAVWSTITRIAMRRQAVERRFNPYVAGPPIREARMFYGRAALLADIESALYKNSIMIHGERRIGKTSLLYQIEERLQAKQDAKVWFIPIYVDLEGAPEAEFFHRLMEGVVEATEQEIAGMATSDRLRYDAQISGDDYSDRDFRRDLRDIIEYLRVVGPRQPRLIFLLDEADILNSFDALTQQQLRRILQDAFAQNVGAVVAGVNISKAWDRLESPWYNMFVETELVAFGRQDAERLMREPVEGFYDWDEDAIHYVWAQSQGRPHRIQQICLEAVNVMLDGGRRRITLQDAQLAYDHLLAAEANGHPVIIQVDPASHTLSEEA